MEPLLSSGQGGWTQHARGWERLLAALRPGIFGNMLSKGEL